MKATRDADFGKMKRNKQEGFTALELLLVATVAVVLIAIVAEPIQNSIQKYRLSTTAHELASEIERARNMALAQGSAFEISINASAGSLQIVDLSDPNNPIRSSRNLEHGIAFTAVPSQPIRLLPRGYVRGGSFEINDGNGWKISIEVPAAGKTKVSKMRSAHAATS